MVRKAPHTSVAAAPAATPTPAGGAAAWKLVANASGTNTFAEICATNGLPYSHGCGCYEVSKSESISGSKFLVAMHEDSGEIVEGGDAVRARLKLGSGTIKVSKKDVPTPWTLYVNSTSPNRGIPPGTTVLIRTGPSGGSSAGSKNPQRTSKTDDEDEDEEDEDEDEEDEFDEEHEVRNRAKFLREHGPRAAASRAAFLRDSCCFCIPATAPAPGWIVQAAKEHVYRNWESRSEWPRAFVGCEPQLVSAAFYAGDTGRLTGVWTFSPTGDETSVYYLEGFDDYEFLENVEKDVAAMGFLGADDAFSVSSGDYGEPALYCPALEGFRLADLLSIAATADGKPAAAAEKQEAPTEPQVAAAPAATPTPAGGAAAWKLVANASGTNTFAEICATNGLPYSHGCGCYEVSKSESISGSKFLVAMHEDSGEIVEGGDAVRARLKLGSGTIKVSKKDVPTPWTLYVNSTSPNRGIPPGTTVLIRTGPSGGSSAGTLGSAKALKALAAGDAKVLRKDAFAAFADTFGPMASKARDRFLKLTQFFEMDGDGSDAKFFIRGARTTILHDGFDAFDWPWAYVGDAPQTVLGAVWRDMGKKENPELVALFTLNTDTDENSVFYIDTFAEDDRSVLDELQEGEGGCFGAMMGYEEDVADSFTASHDAEVHRLYCPALEGMSRAMVTKKTKRPREDEE